jgi:hypothetical protein
MTAARILSVLAISACAPAVVVPAASAADVSLDEVQVVGAAPGQFALTYRAAPGEGNRLTARETAPGRAWSFRDAGAPVVAGPNCAAGGDGVVTCTAPAPLPAMGPPPLNTVAIVLGDGDDSVLISGSRFGGTEVEAGGGDDALVVSAGWVQASMGPGDDRARGEGDDLMGGGLRRGGLAASGGPGADVIDAAPGADVDALYFDATRGVRVSTDGHANDGAPGERDDVGRRVRTISAGARDDVLDARRARGPVTMYGWAGNDRLYASPAGGGLQGGPGDDILRGGPGRDHLGGEDGDDRLFGGGGDDILSGNAGRNVATGGGAHDSYFISSEARDVIHAGDGDRDQVDCTMLPRRLEVDPVDRLTGCAFPVAVVDRPRLDRRRLHLTLACPRLAPGGCRVGVRLIDTSPHPLADARFTIAAGHRARRAIHLHHLPRNQLLTAIIVNHRARPPASQRTTVASFQLGDDCPAGHDGEAVCPPPSPPPRSSTPPP